MSDDGSGSPFDEALRAIAAEASRVARQIADADPEELARASGLDVDRLRSWTEEARRRLGWPAPASGGPEPKVASDLPLDPEAELSRPHPRARASEPEGRALAALDSGRWAVEPGGRRLVSAGPGPTPTDPERLARRLVERDWVDGDGDLTLSGSEALSRWLKEEGRDGA